jgi:PIN domain nuclease of toxin-antitoxin system
MDTHCLIWFQESNPKLPVRILNLLKNPVNTIFFSQINLYEISIKQRLGKLPAFTNDVNQVYDAAIIDDFTFLPISNKHLHAYQRIPLMQDHRDPFDILLIATAHEETLIILSNDEKFLLYPEMVECIW